MMVFCLHFFLSVCLERKVRFFFVCLRERGVAIILLFLFLLLWPFKYVFFIKGEKLLY